MYRIRRKHVGHYVVSSPSWLSNAHWAIRRDLVKNAPLLSNSVAAKAWLGEEIDFRDKDDSAFEKFFAGERKPFRVSRLYVGGYNDARLLVSEGYVAFVSSQYIDMLGLYSGHVLYAKDGFSPLADAETMDAARFVLMPMKFPNEAKDIEADLRRWLDRRAEADSDAEEHAVTTAASAASGKDGIS